MANSGVWCEADVAGRVCDVFEPPAGGGQSFAIVYLHDHISPDERPTQGQAQASPLAAELARRTLRTIAPWSGPSWWTDRIFPPFDAETSTERYVLERLLPYLAERWNARPPAVGLAGEGMGAQGALRLALKHPREFPVVAAVSPAIDYYRQWNEEPSLAELYRDAEAARQDSATLHVHPLAWPRNMWFACDPADSLWYDGADRLRMKLAALGIPFECDLETSAHGNAVLYRQRMAQRAVDFLVARLEAESRRVV